LGYLAKAGIANATAYIHSKCDFVHDIVTAVNISQKLKIGNRDRLPEIAMAENVHKQLLLQCDSSMIM
jgi:hypothetical protein